MACGQNGRSGPPAMPSVERGRATGTGPVQDKNLEGETVKENGRRSQFAEL